MSVVSYRHDYISEQDYLESEKISDIKHEYIDGDVYAMAGASKNHQLIISKIIQKFSNHLEGTSCDAISSDIKVRVDTKYFYPDVIVICNHENEDPYFTESPRIIVEVLSESTSKYDRTFKRIIYKTIPSLEEYVLIEQDKVEIEICRKSENWQPTHYFLGEDITFESIGLTLSVHEIYQRVDNADMRAFSEIMSEAKK